MHDNHPAPFGLLTSLNSIELVVQGVLFS
jgi:hypothetical protein